MTAFTFNSPDGKSYTVNGPDGATQDQAWAMLQHQLGNGGATPSLAASAALASTPAAPPAPPRGIIGQASDTASAFLHHLGNLPHGIAQTVENGLAVPFREANAIRPAARAFFGLAPDTDPVANAVIRTVDNDNRAMTEREQAYQAGTPNSGGAYAGAAVGEVLPFLVGAPARALEGVSSFVGNRVAGALPKILAPTGAKIAGGAAQGAVVGATQPVVGPQVSLADLVTGDQAPADPSFWDQKARQVGLGAATGGVATPIVSKVANGAVNLAKAGADFVRARSVPPFVSDGAVRDAVDRLLQAQGQPAGSAPQAVLDSVARQAREALQAGQKLDPAAALRKAQAEAVGLTGDAGLTTGQATRDPMQYANERNLVGVRIGTPTGQGNPLSDRFQNQANAMQGVFDRAGARGATDEHAAGTTILDALRNADAPVKGAVDDLYAGARAMNNGRTAELERGTFSQAANKALDDEMLGHALPADVRSLLNDITSGKTPFNVDAATQIDTILSRAQRRVQSGQQPDLSAGMAIGKVREALHATPLVVDGAEPAAAAAGGVEDAAIAGGQRLPGAPQLGGPVVDRTLPVPSNGNQVGQVLPNARTAAAQGIDDNGANARAAFDQARRAARDRFATIEATPALKAALNDAAPDKFVRDFILTAPTRDVQSLRGVLANSPEALMQARAQIADHLKRAAFGNNASGDGGFAAERYLNTLRNLGREKLSVFFTPEEMVQFNLAGKVMSDLGSIPAGARGAVNTSGTGAFVMNLLSKISSSPLTHKIPFAGAITRAVANGVGEARTAQMMDKALTGSAAIPQPRTELSPQMLSAISALFPIAATANGTPGQ